MRPSWAGGSCHRLRQARAAGTTDPAAFFIVLERPLQNVTISSLRFSDLCHNVVTIHDLYADERVLASTSRSPVIGRKTMKTNHAKQKGTRSKESAAYLAARAAEAEKQAESARRLARLAKTRFKDARKAFKQAKKFAKQARKEAKSAAKALKQQVKRTSKRPKKTSSPAPGAKVIPKRNARQMPTAPKRVKPDVPVSPPVRPAVPTAGAGPDISQA